MDSCIATESRPPIPPRSPLRSRSHQSTSKKVAFAAEPLYETNEFYSSLDHSIDQAIESLEHLWPPQQTSVNPTSHLTTTTTPDDILAQDYFFSHSPSSDSSSSLHSTSSGNTTITSHRSTGSVKRQKEPNTQQKSPHAPAASHGQGRIKRGRMQVSNGDAKMTDDETTGKHG